MNAVKSIFGNYSLFKPNQSYSRRKSHAGAKVPAQKNTSTTKTHASRKSTLNVSSTDRSAYSGSLSPASRLSESSASPATNSFSSNVSKQRDSIEDDHKLRQKCLVIIERNEVIENYERVKIAFFNKLLQAQREKLRKRSLERQRQHEEREQRRKEAQLIQEQLRLQQLEEQLRQQQQREKLRLKQLQEDLRQKHLQEKILQEQLQQKLRQEQQQLKKCLQKQLENKQLQERLRREHTQESLAPQQPNKHQKHPQLPKHHSKESLATSQQDNVPLIALKQLNQLRQNSSNAMKITVVNDSTQTDVITSEPQPNTERRERRKNATRHKRSQKANRHQTINDINNDLIIATNKPSEQSTSTYTTSPLKSYADYSKPDRSGRDSQLEQQQRLIRKIVKNDEPRTPTTINFNGLAIRPLKVRVKKIQLLSDETPRSQRRTSESIVLADHPKPRRICYEFEANDLNKRRLLQISQLKEKLRCELLCTLKSGNADKTQETNESTPSQSRNKIRDHVKEEAKKKFAHSRNTLKQFLCNKYKKTTQATSAPLLVNNAAEAVVSLDAVLKDFPATTAAIETLPPVEVMQIAIEEIHTCSDIDADLATAAATSLTLLANTAASTAPISTPTAAETLLVIDNNATYVEAVASEPDPPDKEGAAVFSEAQATVVAQESALSDSTKSSEPHMALEEFILLRQALPKSLPLIVNSDNQMTAVKDVPIALLDLEATPTVPAYLFNGESRDVPTPTFPTITNASGRTTPLVEEHNKAAMVSEQQLEETVHSSSLTTHVLETSTAPETTEVISSVLSVSSDHEVSSTQETLYDTTAAAMNQRDFSGSQPAELPPDSTTMLVQNNQVGTTHHLPECSYNMRRRVRKYSVYGEVSSHGIAEQQQHQSIKKRRQTFCVESLVPSTAIIVSNFSLDTGGGSSCVNSSGTSPSTTTMPEEKPPTQPLLQRNRLRRNRKNIRHSRVQKMSVARPMQRTVRKMCIKLPASSSKLPPPAATVLAASIDDSTAMRANCDSPGDLLPLVHIQRTYTKNNVAQKVFVPHEIEECLVDSDTETMPIVATTATSTTSHCIDQSAVLLAASQEQEEKVESSLVAVAPVKKAKACTYMALQGAKIKRVKQKGLSGMLDASEKIEIQVTTNTANADMQTI